jgi:hydrogenase-4 component E
VLRLSAVNLVVVGVLLLNLFMLGTSRIRALIHAAALQGVALSVLPLLIGGHTGWNPLLLALATVTLKGGVIPRMLRRALREAQIKREIEPLIGLVPTMLLGAAGTLLSIAFASQLPLEPQHRELLIVPASFSTFVT